MISKRNSLPKQEFSFEDLKVWYHLGEGGVKRRDPYIEGVATNIGKIEIGLWEELAKETILKAGENHLYKSLVDYCTNEQPWLRKKCVRERYALELHMDRFFDNPTWDDYELFNQKYRRKNHESESTGT